MLFIGQDRINIEILSRPLLFFAASQVFCGAAGVKEVTFFFRRRNVTILCFFCENRVKLIVYINFLYFRKYFIRLTLSKGSTII